MAAKKQHNGSTEAQIKEAARRVFTSKGFAATRTRDIAEESGVNLALINYYFRSKENLYNIIMVEQVQLFLHSVTGILNDPTTSLFTKLEIAIDHYIDMLIANPGLPIFGMNEVNTNPENLVEKVGFGNHNAGDLFIAKQWLEMTMAGEIQPIHPLHLISNVVAMTVFPFIAAPLLRNRSGMSVKEYNEMMLQRKKLIPHWVKTILTTPVPEPNKPDRS